MWSSVKSEVSIKEYKVVRLDQIAIPDMEVDEDMRDSIANVGIKYPPRLREAPEDHDKEYLIEDGRRRLVAIEDLGWEKVKAYISGDPYDADELLPVILNTQRSPNPAMESEIIKQKLDGGMSQSELSDVLGISQGSISKRLKLQDLIDPLFEAVEMLELGPEKGYKLAKLDEERQRELYEENDLNITNKQIKQERKDEITDDLDMESIENPEEEHTGSNRVHFSFEKDEATLILGALEDYDQAEDEKIDNITEKIEGEL